MKSAGLSARQMAAELTLRGIQTPTGARWHAQTVLRMIDRAGCIARQFRAGEFASPTR
jgi:Recombinase